MAGVSLDDFQTSIGRVRFGAAERQTVKLIGTQVWSKFLQTEEVLYFMEIRLHQNFVCGENIDTFVRKSWDANQVSPMMAHHHDRMVLRKRRNCCEETDFWAQLYCHALRTRRMHRFCRWYYKARIHEQPPSRASSLFNFIVQAEPPPFSASHFLVISSSASASISSMDRFPSFQILLPVWSERNLKTLLEMTPRWICM